MSPTLRRIDNNSQQRTLTQTLEANSHSSMSTGTAGGKQLKVTNPEYKKAKALIGIQSCPVLLKGDFPGKELHESERYGGSNWCLEKRKKTSEIPSWQTKKNKHQTRQQAVISLQQGPGVRRCVWNPASFPIAACQPCQPSCLCICHETCH